MWGAPRDLELIGKMQSTFAPMASFIEENHMTTAEGVSKEETGNTNVVTSKIFQWWKPNPLNHTMFHPMNFRELISMILSALLKNAREIFVAHTLDN